MSYGLAVSQPWGWAVVSGAVEVINRDMPPRPELVGERITLVATEVDVEHAWTLDGLLGIDTRANEAAWRRSGVIGTVLLEGWMRTERGGAVIETFRPGSDKPFRTRKGLQGPFGWIVRRPKVTSGDPAGLRLIRARFHETKAYGEQLLCYARQYGCDGMTADHLAQLERLGFRALAKGKVNGGPENDSTGSVLHPAG